MSGFWGSAELSFQTCCARVCCRSLQIVFTESPDVQNIPIHLHYWRRLIIDSHSYRNRSDQLNLQLCAISFASGCNDSAFIEMGQGLEGLHRPCRRWAACCRGWSCQNDSRAPRQGVRHVASPSPRLIRAVDFGAKRAACERRTRLQPAVPLCAVIKGITSLTGGQCGMIVQSTSPRCFITPLPFSQQ